MWLRRSCMPSSRRWAPHNSPLHLTWSISAFPQFGNSLSPFCKFAKILFHAQACSVQLLSYEECLKSALGLSRFAPKGLQYCINTAPACNAQWRGHHDWHAVLHFLWWFHGHLLLLADRRAHMPACNAPVLNHHTCLIVSTFVTFAVCMVIVVSDVHKKCIPWLSHPLDSDCTCEQQHMEWFESIVQLQYQRIGQHTQRNAYSIQTCYKNVLRHPGTAILIF